MCCCKAVWVWKRFPHSRQKMAMSDPAEQRQRSVQHHQRLASASITFTGGPAAVWRRVFTASTVLKGAGGVSAASRAIKISNATLQSKLVSTEHFSPAEIKSARLGGALTQEITEGQQTHWRRNTLQHTPFTLFQLPGRGKLWGKE